MRHKLFVVQVPIPIAQLRLGAIIPKAEQPAQDAYFPHLADEPREPLKRIAPQISYRAALEKYSKHELRLHLPLLGVGIGRESDVNYDVASIQGKLYEITNPSDWFDRICQDQQAREKMEEWAGITMTAGWLITGCRTFVDARYVQRSSQRKEGTLEGEVDLATVALASGLPLVPGSAGMVGAGLQHATGTGDQEAYFTPGEQVYAVQLRKIRFRPLGTGAPKLSGKNMWKQMTSIHRGAQDDAETLLADLQLSAQVPMKLGEKVTARTETTSDDIDEYVLFAAAADDDDDDEDDEDNTD